MVALEKLDVVVHSVSPFPIMSTHGKYQDKYQIIMNLVNNTIFFVDSSGPASCEVSYQLLRFSRACARVHSHLFKQPLYFLFCGGISVLFPPCDVLLGIRGICYFHKSAVSMIL